MILLRVKNPDLVQLKDRSVINGSDQLKAVLQNAGLKRSKKLTHADRLTDGWYRLEFPIDKNIEIATLNYSTYLSGTPNDSLWIYQ